MNLDFDLEDMAGRLEASGDYRILRRIKRRDVITQDDGQPHKIGVVVDTETTGLDHRQHQVIELGMVKFDFSPVGEVFRVLDEFQGFHDPEEPLSPEIAALTGITDEMLAGHAIDPQAVERFIDDAHVVIAHNAAFDRLFCERPWDAFAAKPWACSLSEIDWQDEGFEGQKLGYLLAGCGLFHDGHRAVEDCRALLEILARPLPSGEPALKRLLDRARLATVRIWAENSPFGCKDTLKARGYRWADGSDGGRKAWWCDVAEDAFAEEIAFLRCDIYGWDVNLPTKRLTARERFSERAL